MKIALELQPCIGLRSGVGTYTYELAKRLNNSDITFIGNLFNFTYPPHKGCTVKDINFTIQYNPFIPYGVYRRIWNCIPFGYNDFFRNKADITHFFNYIVPPRVSGKVITTIYDLAFQFFPETLDPKNLKRIQRDIFYSLSRSDRILTISENTRNELITEFDIPSCNIEIIYPSFNISKSNLPIKTLQEKFKIKNDYILYVGNLEPRKNIERLILAYAKLKKESDIPYQLVLAGQKGWLYNQIFETVSSKNLQDDVIFTGYIGEVEKAALYRNAALFVYPSLYEGFGIPILEAMSVGTPVVCSSTSSMPEVAGDAAILVNPLDTDSIANGIYHLITDQALRQSKIGLGKARAAKFSWDKSAQDLMTLYRSMQ